MAKYPYKEEGQEGDGREGGGISNSNIFASRKGGVAVSGDERREGMDLRACHLLYGNTSDRNFERKRPTDPPHVANRAGRAGGRRRGALTRDPNLACEDLPNEVCKI